MITILTPTFNRAYTLGRLHESLLNQTNLNFEWVIIDDGSTDNTYELISVLKQKSRFKIKYIKQPNAGKPTAINAGVAHSTASWIFIVDSDDALTNTAIQQIENVISDLPSELNGVCFRKASFTGTLIGNQKKLPSIADLHPSVASGILRGDLAYIFKKTALAQYPFPSFKGEKFVPELFIWNKIGDDGLIRYFQNEAIYLCEYLPDGLSVNFKKQLQANPKGFGLFYCDQINREKNLIKKIKYFIRCLQCKWYQFNFEK